MLSSPLASCSMSRFIDREARETGALSTSDSDSLSSDEGSDHSDNQLSDVIPLQNLTNRNKRKKRKASVLQDSSDSEVDHEKENAALQKPKHKKPRKQQRTESLPSRSGHDAVEETNRLVKKLFSKIKHQESRLKTIEEKLKEATSSSSSIFPSPKRAVKREVPVEVRVSKLDSSYIGSWL